MRTFFILLLIGIALGGLFCMPHIFKKEAPTTGKALIGGTFSSTNHLGEYVTDETYRGKYLLVYFGFTSCPDVCPTDLTVISQAMKLLGDEGKDVQPLFISIDPERDTPVQLKTYLSNFHPSIVGLSGTVEQLKEAAFAYKVYYSKVKDESSAMGYSMDHSAYTYLMDKEGQYITHFMHAMKPEDMAAQIKAKIRKQP